MASWQKGMKLWQLWTCKDVPTLVWRSGFCHMRGLGAGLDTGQTRCMSGTKPQLPGTSKSVWGLLTRTELHSQPPRHESGPYRFQFSLYFLILLYISPVLPRNPLVAPGDNALTSPSVPQCPSQP